MHLYSLSYNPQRPVVCFDELSVPLLDQTIAPLPMQPNTSGRYDYEYAHSEPPARLVIFESLIGAGVVETRRHTKADYVRCLQRGSALFPQADKLVPAPDNLNTHKSSSFYEHRHSLTHTRWLSGSSFMTQRKSLLVEIAELELSALSRH